MTLGKPATGFVQGPRNVAGVKLPGEVVLVQRSNELEVLTVRQDVDAHTALLRGLAEYIGNQTLELNGKVVAFKSAYFDGAEPDDRSAYPGVNVFGVSRGEYDSVGLTPQIIRAPVQEDQHFVSPAEFVQSLGIQIYATNPVERGSAAALVEAAMYPVNWMAGFRLRLPYYFGAYAEYEPMAIEYVDTTDALLKRDRQAAFMLTGRLKVLQLRKIPKGDPRFRAKVE